jgi:restriction system protein
MNPREFEELVCEHFYQQGYNVKVTSYSNDYGVDVFADREKEKIAIQVKMYGHTTRKINRQMVMELHGAKDFFDCTKAIIATDGSLLSDALIVAEKLKIEILYLREIPHYATFKSNTKAKAHKANITFEQIWENYIIPLQGKTLIRDNGKSNQILKVDWSGIERLTSNGKIGKIKIEIFKQAVNKLLKDKEITRDYINQNYVGRASSGIILVLSQVPFFNMTEKPAGLKYEI